MTAFSKDCFVASLLAMTLLTPASISFAAGPAAKCVFTVKKVEFKTRAGDWKTAYEGSLPMDIAADDASVQFANDGRVPPGLYVNVRLTIDETVEVAGNDGLSRTLAGGEVEIRNTASDIDALPGQIQAITGIKPSYTDQGDPGPVRVTLDYDYADRDRTFQMFPARDVDKPFEVKNASKIAISVKANLEETIVHLFPNYYDGFPESDVMIFDFPAEFKDFVIRVDYGSTFVTGKIAVKF